MAVFLFLFCVFWVYVVFSFIVLIVSISAINCREKVMFEMTYCALSETLNRTDSLTVILAFFDHGAWTYISVLFCDRGK